MIGSIFQRNGTPYVWTKRGSAARTVYYAFLYTHSINGGVLGKPGPNSARTRLVIPLARRKIKYGCICKVCKANGGRYSGCIPRREAAIAAKN